LRAFEGFKFAKLQTPIHRMDPRAKFVLTMSISALSLIFLNVFALSLIFLSQLPIVAMAKSAKRWVDSMRAATLLATLIFAMNFITGSTLTYSIAMTLRFLALLSSFSIFFMTTSPDDLGLALEQARVPYTLCFTFTTAVRLVPTMAADAQTVVDAQKSRGLELEKGNLIRRVRNYIPILIPLIVCAIRRSIELAEALESRAFGAVKKRESLTNLQMKISDYLIVIFSLICVALAFYVNLYVQLPALDIPIRFPLIWP